MYFFLLLVDSRSNLVNLSDAIVERACDVNHKLINNNNSKNWELFCFDFFAGPSSISVRIFLVECQCERVNNCNINSSEKKKFRQYQLCSGWRRPAIYVSLSQCAGKTTKMYEKKIFKYALCSVLCGTDFTGIVIKIFHFAFDLTSRLRSTGYEKVKREEQEEEEEGTRTKPIESAYKVKVNTSDTYLSAWLTSDT